VDSAADGSFWCFAPDADGCVSVADVNDEDPAEDAGPTPARVKSQHSSTSDSKSDGGDVIVDPPSFFIILSGTPEIRFSRYCMSVVRQALSLCFKQFI
jgi:hypothetical protein